MLRTKRPCIIEGCEKDQYVLKAGLCAMHYQRVKVDGSPGEAAMRRTPGRPDRGEKPCTQCKIIKPISDFHRDKRNRDGRQSHCKVCYEIRQKDIRRRRIYGISSADYDRMVVEQQHLCLVCNEEPPKLVVDHCHRTGRVRGLLCDRCNRLLGVADDNVELLRKAIAFLT